MNREKNLIELIKRQKKNIKLNKKLEYKDLERVVKNINTFIFNETKCCIWQSYITNKKKPEKGKYINFYFKGSKKPLHRLLYQNYIDDLGKGEYLKFKCENKGECINLNHLEKFTRYNKKEKINPILPKSTKVFFK